MNRLACLAVGLVTFGTLTSVSVAQAPPAPPPTIPKPPAITPPGGPAVPAAPAAIPAAAKTSTSPQQFRQQIETFISGHLARLTAGDAKASKDSRDALVAEITSGNPSSIYKDLYGEALAKLLDPLAGNPSAQVRLQAGVLAAKVAAASDNDRMTPVAAKLLGDSNAGVVLWGMKAAKGVVAQQVQTPTSLAASKLLPAVTAAIAKNPSEGNLAREAYETLQITDISKVARFPANVTATLAPQVLAVMTARTNEYVKALPDQADADRDAGTFFALYAFNGSPQPQKVLVLQQLANQMVLSAEHSVSVSGPVQKATIDQAASAGKSIALIADNLDKAGSNAGTKKLLDATKFFRDIGPIPPSAADVVNGANNVMAALKGIPAYATLTTPQIAPQAAPASQPSN